MGMGTLFIDKLYNWFSQVQGKGWSFLFKCLMIDTKKLKYSSAGVQKIHC
jgi:hypothetical protein